MKFLSLIKTFLFLSAGLFANVTSSCANLHIKATNSSGIIRSGQHYSANMDCRWHLSSNGKMELVFLHFKLDSSADYVNVYDGKSAASPLIGTFRLCSIGINRFNQKRFRLTQLTFSNRTLFQPFSV